MPYFRLATLRDVHEKSLPAQALADKSVQEKRRAITAGSELFVCRLRKKYAPPLALEIDPEEFVVTSADGTATYAGTPSGHAADVKIEVVSGGTILNGVVTTAGPAFTVRVSLEDGLDGTWLPSVEVDGTGVVQVGTVTVTLSGFFAALDSITYSAGPSPAVRASVGAWAAWIMINSIGADPDTLELLKAPYEEAKAFAKELAKGEEAELDQKSDSTPARPEMGSLFTRNTRDGFRYGRP